MRYYEKIHQHIGYNLEERGLDKSLSDMFQKHKLLSFKVWRFLSFVGLFPLCISNALSSKNILTVLMGNAPMPGFVSTLVYFSFAFISFLAPIVFSSILLTHYLPFYKLSQQRWFKKYFGKHLRKFPILASSCDSINYKQEFIIKYSQDKELNLCMSVYYNYLLEFKFSEETKKSLISKRDKLLDIDLNPIQYQKNFYSTVINFIEDFYHYSKSPIILKTVYEQELVDYTDHILDPSLQSAEDLSDFEDYLEELTPQEKHKKKVKEML